jgi:hypothetical protein
MERKARFGWASIAGADAEPVEIIEKNGRTGVLTTGCEDPFWLDDKKAGVLLYANELQRPKPLETDAQRNEREEQYRQYKASHHGWRGWR